MRLGRGYPVTLQGWGGENMSESELPELGEAAPERTSGPGSRPHRKSWLKIGMEVALIAVGVFLGMMGENFRAYMDHRDLAHKSLERFRSEFTANRAEVERVHDRHLREAKAIRAYFQAHWPELQAHSANPLKPLPTPLPDTETDSAGFDYSAWDMALATQSLAYIKDADLVAKMSAAYRLQQMYEDSHRAIAETSYSFSNDVDWLRGVQTYFDDASHYEDLLLKRYDDILPRLDKALGGSADARP